MEIQLKFQSLFLFIMKKIRCEVYKECEIQNQKIDWIANEYPKWITNKFAKL